jgi:putative Holliday junction resolvase
MAKYLGIDYGSKRIGLAVSDDAGEFAFPEAIVENGQQAIRKIKELCEKKGIEAVVLGESMNLAGEPNKIMKEISAFKEKLSELDLPIKTEKEFMTSAAAETMQRYMAEPVQNRARLVKYEKLSVDASAAALILQRYLDKHKNAI